MFALGVLITLWILLTFVGLVMIAVNAPEGQTLGVWAINTIITVALFIIYYNIGAA